MIIPCISLAVSIAALVFIVHNGREIRRLQRQTWADISLAQIYNSRTRYLMDAARRSRRP